MILATHAHWVDIVVLPIFAVFIISALVFTAVEGLRERQTTKLSRDGEPY